MGVRTFHPNDKAYRSLFVSPKILTGMTSALKPVNTFAIFFHRHLEIDSIIDDTVPDPFFFEIDHGNKVKLTYAEKKPHWCKVFH